ncbi:MAG: transcriptional repressor [Parcubacteria group bacterium]|nr:MAG: transcriptional repressor [Parcubacteria group bacterium]
MNSAYHLFPAQTRLTRPRQIVLTVLRHDFSHPTAEDIYKDVRKTLPRVSLATIYRNLNFLVKNNLAEEINVPDGPSRFDGHLKDHDHFICHSCKKIYNLPKYPLRKNYLPNKNYKIGGFKLDLFGICATCQNREPCLNHFKNIH